MCKRLLSKFSNENDHYGICDGELNGSTGARLILAGWRSRIALASSITRNQVSERVSTCIASAALYAMPVGRVR
jgi:hypothetical protein